MASAVCVFCGSSTRVERHFLDVGQEMGRLLAAHGLTLVYGGGSIGLMGEMARAVQQGGGRVIGVIPHAMNRAEIAYRDADELIMTDNMRQRKAAMDDRCDAFVALPGGLGTLEELIEVMTHRVLNFHDKPVVIVNTNGFYDPLLSLFDHFVQHQFARPEHLGCVHVVGTPSDAIAYLTRCLHPVRPGTSGIPDAGRRHR
jgi:uncharacterized protein (TIGR00730 family)